MKCIKDVAAYITRKHNTSISITCHRELISLPYVCHVFFVIDEERRKSPYYNGSKIVNWVLVLLNVASLQGRIQDLIGGGGAQIMTGLNCQWCAAVLCEQSKPFSAWGPGPALGPWKLLGISLLNMHSLHFGVPFYTIFEIIKY